MDTRTLISQNYSELMKDTPLVNWKFQKEEEYLLAICLWLATPKENREIIENHFQHIFKNILNMIGYDTEMNTNLLTELTETEQPIYTKSQMQRVVLTCIIIGKGLGKKQEQTFQERIDEIIKATMTTNTAIEAVINLGK